MSALVIELIDRIALVDWLVDELFHVIEVGLQFSYFVFHVVELEQQKEVSFGQSSRRPGVWPTYLVHFFHELLLKVNHFGVMVDLLLLDMKLLEPAKTI